MPSQYNFKTASLLLFAAQSNALAVALGARQNLGTSPNLAVLGDSWGSGVAYSPFTTYDNNKDSCLRYSQAYGAQLEADKNWAGSKTNTMQFVACSGSVLYSIAAQDNNQMDKLSGSVDAVILTVGGNNVGFYNIANNCIYHVDRNTDFGPEFPDPAGKCQQMISTSEEYIRGIFKDQLRDTYNDMLEKDVVKNNGNLKIYHTGYARFFNVLGEGDEDWCTKEKVSFNIPAFGGAAGKSPSHLTKDLREKINDLTIQTNKAIREVTEEPAYKEKFRYIDIDPAFEKHRFCELGSTKSNQYYSSDVWLWNLVAPGLGAMTESGTEKPAGYDQMWDFQFGDAPLVTEEAIRDDKVQLYGDTTGGGALFSGWTLRPFHPKGQGYLKVKELITGRLIADKIPGTVVPEKITSDMCVVNENSANYPCCANGTCPPP